MTIHKYTPDMQAKLQCKVKAEPWLHIIFDDVKANAFNDAPWMQSHKAIYQQDYAIYVWDTREIVVTGSLSGELSKLITNSGNMPVDNGKPFTGRDASEWNKRCDAVRQHSLSDVRRGDLGSFYAFNRVLERDPWLTSKQFHALQDRAYNKANARK